MSHHALARAFVARRLQAPAAEVWRYFQWENLHLMVPGGFFAKVEYEEQRPVPGARRWVWFADGQKIQERLETIEADDFAYQYRITDTANHPIAEYLGSVRVTPAGSTACSVRLSCDFTPVGITVDEWRTIYTAMQNQLLDFIQTQVEAASNSK